MDNSVPDPLSDEKIARFRQQIRDTALRQVSSAGVDKVSMRSIAGELGYSATALYSYFRNKGEIIAAIQAATIEELNRHLQEAQQGKEPPDRLPALLAAYQQYAHQHATAYQLAFAPRAGPAADYKELDEAIDALHNTLTRAVHDALPATQSTRSATAGATLLWAGLHGAIALDAAGKLPTALTLADIASALGRRIGAGDASDPLAEEAQRREGQQFSLDL